MEKNSVLIVDDDDTLRRTTSDILSFKGYTTLTANCGKDALTLAHQESPNVVLLDLRLSDIAGLEVLRQIKAFDPEMECIILTGNATQDSAIEAINLGAYSYVTKPYDMENLLLMIRRAIEKQRSAQRERFLAQLLENVRESLVVTDMEGQTIYWSKGAEALYKRKAAEVLGCAFDFNVAAADLEREQLRRAQAATQGAWQGRCYQQRSTGEYFWSDTLISLALNEHGQPFGLIRMDRDITERTRIYEESQAIGEISRLFLSERSMPEIYAEVAAILTTYLHFPLVAVELYDAAAQEMVFVGTVGVPSSSADPLRIPVNQTVSGQVVLSGEPYITQHALQHTEYTAAILRSLQVETFMCIPLKVGNAVLGTLSVASPEVMPPLTLPPLTLPQGTLQIVANHLAQEIGKRQAEEQLLWNSQLNAALAALYTPLVTPETTIHDNAQEVQSLACQITDSRYGFVAMIDPQNGDNVILTRNVMTSEEEDPAAPTHYIRLPREANGTYRGLWGHVLNTRQPFFTNTPATHAAARGMPASHFPLQRFLAVPVMLGAELVGMLALANAHRPYNDRDLEAVTRIAEFFGLAIQRKRYENALYSSEERFREVVLSISDHIYVSEITTEGRFINRYLSPRIESLTGYPPETFLDDWGVWRRCIHPEDQALAAEQVRQLAAGQSSEVEYRLVQRDGTIIWVRDSARVRVPAMANPLIYGVVGDITR